jgi:hypothetical protein
VACLTWTAFTRIPVAPSLAVHAAPCVGLPWIAFAPATPFSVVSRMHEICVHLSLMTERACPSSVAPCRPLVCSACTALVCVIRIGCCPSSHAPVEDLRPGYSFPGTGSLGNQRVAYFLPWRLIPAHLQPEYYQFMPPTHAYNCFLLPVIFPCWNMTCALNSES